MRVTYVGDSPTVHPEYGLVEHGSELDVPDALGAALVVDSAHWRKSKPPTKPEPAKKATAKTDAEKEE